VAIVHEPGASGAAEKPERAPSLHKTLCDRAARWLRKSCGCSVVLSELTSYATEIPDAIGWRSDYSVLVEVKVSRADFLADAGKPHRMVPEQGMGMFRFYLCPPGVIYPRDLPERWGLLWVRATRVEKVVAPRGNIWMTQPEFIHRRNADAEIILLASALRRAQAAGTEVRNG